MRQRDDESSSSSSLERVRPSAVQRLLGNVHVTGPDTRWVKAEGRALPGNSTVGRQLLGPALRC